MYTGASTARMGCMGVLMGGSGPSTPPGWGRLTHNIYILCSMYVVSAIYDDDKNKR
jgi:hypothetical protein